jgi:hypothetical protein
MRGIAQKVVCAAAALAALSAATVYGNTYEVEAKFMTVVNKRATHLVTPGGSRYVYAGQYWFDRVGLTPDAQENPAWWLGDEFGGYCIDINQTINWNYQGTWQIEPLDGAPIGPGGDAGGAMGAAKAELLKRLWGNYFESGPYAEFQVAVWELLNETTGTYDVTDGAFYASRSYEVDRTTINAWLDEITADAYDGPVAELMYAMTSANTQDFAVLIEMGGGGHVPEPVTLAGLMLGVGGLVGYIRKRRIARA